IWEGEPGDQQIITYQDLARRVQQFSNGLLKLGYKTGDRAIIYMPMIPELPIAMLACARLGIAHSVVFGGFSAEALKTRIQDLEATLVVTADGGWRRGKIVPLKKAVDEALEECPGVKHSVVYRRTNNDITMAEGRDVDWADAIANVSESCPAVELDSEHPLYVLYTSGTTGKPKGAELSHSNLLLNCAVVVPKLIPLDRDDVALATLPLFHSFGQTCIQNAMISLGATFTLLPRFTPEAALEIIQRDRVTLFAGVPTMYFAILNHEGADAYDLSSIDWCMCGGAPMPVEVMKAFEAKYGVTILEGYGLSETSPVASFNVLDRPRKPGSIGYPAWGVEMCIMNEKDEPLPDDEVGEICIRGHNVMKGYWQRPEATAETMRQGWFHSGDVGMRDADGSYFIVDRKKDMIIRGGFNVYPREVEEVLYAHTAIVEAAVIGVPHESHGEEVKAVVALAKGASVTVEEIIAYSKENLAAYKYPRIVELVDELPKGPTGKILKRALKE
ncbi:MAG: long-chain fatty acid--CoA ligase, partial [Myxococcales bacterium]|nr:long-chain fatty acid--CoA ligase [Myxococcales bacterium]